MIEEVLKDLTAAIRENTEELARQSALVKELIPTERNVALNAQEVGCAVSAAITNAVTEAPKESQEVVRADVAKDEQIKISEDQKAALRKEGIRLKKAGKGSDFKKVLTDYKYERISDIEVKDYDEILEITKSIK